MKRFLLAILFASLAAFCQDKKGGASYVNTFGKGAAAVSRTVEEKLRDILSIKDYGAKCDNATIDTTAIQAAAAAALAAGGGTVFVPPGKCLVDARISLGTNVTLAAAGPYATIKVADGAFNVGTNWIFPAADNTPTVISSGPGTTNVHVIGLIIDMNGANQTPTTNRNGSVYFYQVTKSSIEGNTFLYSLASTTDGTVIGSPVALLDQSDFNIVAHNYITGPGDVYTVGNFLAGGIFVQGVGNKIHHNDVIGTTDESYVANWYDAVPAFTTRANIFEANTFQGVVAVGSLAAYHAENADDTTFSENKCIGPVGICFKASPEGSTGSSMSGAHFVNNSASGATQAGISAGGNATYGFGVSRMSVLGGSSTANVTGITLYHSITEVQIQGVQINANTGPGIQVINDATHIPRGLSITNNTIMNNGSAGGGANPGIIFWSTDAVTGTSFGPDVLIQNNIITDTRTPKYQSYALKLLSSKGGFIPTLTRWIIGPNNFSGNLTAPSTVVANNPVLVDSKYLHNLGDPLDYVSKATVDWTETGNINGATDIYQNFHSSGFPNLHDFRIRFTGGVNGADARGFMDLHGNPRFVPDTTASLAACGAGTDGTVRAISNAGSSAWGDVLTGGGALHVLAYCNGTSWIVVGGIPPDDITLKNDKKIFWKDSVGTLIPALWLDGSNNFHVGPQVAPVSAGDVFFYARGFNAFKLVKAPGGQFTIEPINDEDLNVGTATKRVNILSAMNATVYSKVSSGSIAQVSIQTADAGTFVNLRAGSVKGDNYNLLLPSTAPGAGNKILLTGTAPNYELVWSDPVGPPNMVTSTGGTAYTIPRFSAAQAIVDSVITESGVNIAVSAGDGEVNAMNYTRNTATAGGLALKYNWYFGTGAYRRFAAGYPATIAMRYDTGGIEFWTAATGAKDSAISWFTSTFSAAGDWTIPGGLAMTGILSGVTTVTGSWNPTTTAIHTLGTTDLRWGSLWVGSIVFDGSMIAPGGSGIDATLDCGTARLKSITTSKGIVTAVSCGT